MNDALDEYSRKVNEFTAQGRRWGLTDAEIEFAMEESLLYLRDKYPELYERSLKARKDELRHGWWGSKAKFFTYIIVLLAVCYGLSHHKPTHNFVERNIQEVIYPFMKLYRHVTLPLIKLYPSLTELYDESCLVENPYFQIPNMDCWPCENVKFVVNLTKSTLNYHIGLPFIVKVNEPSVTWTDIQEVYMSSKLMFDQDARRVYSNYGWSVISEVMKHSLEEVNIKYKPAHVKWRINRMEPGRTLRSLLKPPKKVPKHATAIGVERYLILDGPTAPPYVLPSTEGANVFVKQLSGSRLIVLDPTPECRKSCHRLSVLLQPQHILWYNWWYWRPRSVPVSNSSEAALTFIGSSV